MDKKPEERVYHGLPPDPWGPWKNAAIHGAVGAAIGVVGGAVLLGYRSMAQLRKMAIDTGIISAIIGYFQGERNITEHRLRTENIHLRQHVDDLKAEKSFVEHITKESVTQECKGRS